MKWRGREQSSNIEDRRSQGGGRLGGSPFGSGGGFRMPTGGGRGRGGMGSLIGVVVVLGIVWLVTGVNPIDMLSGSNSSTTTSPSANSASRSLPASPEQADLRDFVGVVVKETEDMWTEVFAAQNEEYPKPNVVLFSGQTNTACGTGDARTGPFYCPGDQKVYLDLSFYDELRQQFGAPGDFAQAYVLAHEIGHHVQNIVGVLPEFDRLRQTMSQEESNAYSVRVELQADCYAGVWANYAGQEDLLDNGDIEEALNAANQIGDDTLQKRSQGFAVPKTFNHGTSAQRKTWFETGYRTGNPADCDTFSGSV